MIGAPLRQRHKGTTRVETERVGNALYVREFIKEEIFRERLRFLVELTSRAEGEITFNVLVGSNLTSESNLRSIGSIKLNFMGDGTPEAKADIVDYREKVDVSFGGAAPIEEISPEARGRDVEAGKTKIKVGAITIDVAAILKAESNRLKYAVAVVNGAECFFSNQNRRTEPVAPRQAPSVS